MFETRGLYPIEGPGGLAINPETYASRRLFVWSGSAGSFAPATPAAGGHVDGVTGDAEGGRVRQVTLKLPGTPVRVEAGAAFGASVDLMTAADGRAVAWTTGNRVVARSLEAAGAAGAIVWVVMV